MDGPQLPGIEYQTIDAHGVLHLDYLPYSHSLLTGFGTANLAYIIIRWGFNTPVAALAVALAMASHIVYDLMQHEPDIQIAWFVSQPRLGLNIGPAPLLDFVIETALTIACWWYFKGDWELLAVILFLSVTNLRMMFADGNGRALANNHFILPTIILLQTALTLVLIWVFGHQRNDQIARETSPTPLTGAHKCSPA